MRKFVFLFLLAGVALGATATANAQGLVVTVPFDFVVSGNTLPADNYVIRQGLLPNDNTGLAFLGQHKGILARATEIDSHYTGTKLVFQRIDGQYFLSDVVTLEGTLHFAGSRKSTQKAQVAAPEIVTIVASN